jgi:3-hydroxymyristoyl/3-hydroxydecanoyl-(acyl carrier protein) dehydratase
MLFSKEFFTSPETAVFPASWPLFAGHFPGDPVVPAYALLGLVHAIAEREVGRPLEVARCERLKLARAVRPGEAVRCELEVEPAGAGVRVRARLSKDSGAVGTATLVLAPID